MKKIVDIEQFRRKTASQPPGAKVEPEKASPTIFPGPSAVPANAGVTPVKNPLADLGSSPHAEIQGQRLTKPAKDFRKKFLAALEELKKEANCQLAKAASAGEVKAKINVSLVLKRAKSSPLTAYSPLHKDTLLPLVDQAAHELDIAINQKFPKTLRPKRDTLAAAKEELSDAKASFESQLSKLASQKLTQYIDSFEK